jgi:hypothetical protein
LTILIHHFCFKVRQELSNGVICLRYPWI